MNVYQIIDLLINITSLILTYLAYKNTQKK